MLNLTTPERSALHLLLLSAFGVRDPERLPTNPETAKRHALAETIALGDETQFPTWEVLKLADDIANARFEHKAGSVIFDLNKLSAKVGNRTLTSRAVRLAGFYLETEPNGQRWVDGPNAKEVLTFE